MNDTEIVDLIVSGPFFDGERIRHGYVAVKGNLFCAVGDCADGVPAELVGSDTRVIEVPDGFIVPGLFDDHTFFTSQLLEVGGLQAGELDREALLAGISESDDDVVVILGVDDRHADGVFVAITEAYPEREFILLSSERDVCRQTSGALAAVGCVDGASNEGLAPLYALLASNPRNVDAAIDHFAEIAARNGVVGVKDIAFDNYLGMGQQIGARLASGNVPLVMACACQPVLAPADLEFWATAGEEFGPHGPHFRGFKLMTDGSFDEGQGAMLEGSGRNNSCDWDSAITYEESRRIVAAGSPLILNADGDRAVRECIDIFERLIEEYGPLPNGCSLSDGSILDPADAMRLARLGIPIETYPQMVRFDYYSLEFLDRYLTAQGKKHFAPFDHLTKAGVPILAATDFPLTEPSLPESLLSASERLLWGDTDAKPIDNRGIDRLTVLKAWTSNTADALSLSEYSGRIRVGDPAHIAVFDKNLATASVRELAEARVILTIAGGHASYEGIPDIR